MQKNIVSILRPREQELLQYKNSNNGLYEYKNQVKESSTATNFYRNKRTNGSYSVDNSGRKQTPRIQLRKVQKPFNGKCIDNLEQELVAKNGNQLKLLTTYASDFNHYPNIKKQKGDDLNKTYDLIQHNKANKSPMKWTDMMNSTGNYMFNVANQCQNNDNPLLEKQDLIVKNNKLPVEDKFLEQQCAISPINIRNKKNKQRTKSVYSLDKKNTPIIQQNSQDDKKKPNNDNKYPGNNPNSSSQIPDNNNICEQFEKKSDIESCASKLNIEEYQKLGQNFTPEQKLQIEQQNKMIQQLQNRNQNQLENESNCFSVDYSFLDNISASDPRLQKLLSDELFTSKNFDLDYILEQNADYFHHLFNNCACAKCTCGRCRCNYAQLKLNYKNGYLSVYKKEYLSKSGTSQQMITPPLFEKTYDSLADKQKKDPIFDPSHTTTQKGDYVKHPLPKRQVKEVTPRMNLPITALTTYACSFVNWKDYDPSFQFRDPHFKTTFNYKNKCDYQTTYNQSFDNNLSENKVQPNAVVSDIKKLQQNNPLPDLWSDNKKATNYKDNFRNYSINDLGPNSNSSFAPDKQVNQIPSWNGQYKSVNRNDFNGQKEKLCPAQTNNLTKPWKIKLINKMKLLKQMKDERRQQLQIMQQSAVQLPDNKPAMQATEHQLQQQQSQISPLKRNLKIY